MTDELTDPDGGELDELRQASAATKRRLGAITHDLRNTSSHLFLAVMALERDLQQLGKRTPPELAEHLRALRASATLLDMTLADLKEASLPEGEQTREQADLALLVQEVVTSLQPAAEQEHTTIRLEAPTPVDGVWQTTGLSRAVANLVGNAIKYGGSTPITVRIETRPELALITVEDHGPGIAPEEQERIFEKFTRGTHEPGVPGLGLGLWAAQKYASDQGGRIVLESSTAGGTRFTIELPIRE